MSNASLPSSSSGPSWLGVSDPTTLSTGDLEGQSVTELDILEFRHTDGSTATRVGRGPTRNQTHPDEARGHRGV
jgi:hypothetical protein